MTPTTQPAEHTTTLVIQRLTGTWICRCICGKQYAQHVGSTPCCGSVAEIIAHDPDYCVPAPESAISKARSCINLFVSWQTWFLGRYGDEMSEQEQGDALDTLERAVAAQDALSNLTPATDKQG